MDSLRAWKQNSAGVRTYFLYDGSDPVCELDSSGSVTATNTFGAQGLLSRHVTSTNASTFYTFDERGNVAQRTGSSGAVLSSDLYDAYGSQLAGGAAGDPWGFEGQAGYYTDSETGLLLLTHRYYDPQTGRFVTRDPMGYDGGINLYGYTGNDPVNEADPTGFGSIIVRGKGKPVDGKYRSRVGDPDEAKGWPHYDKDGTNGRIWIDSGGNIYVGNDRQGTIDDRDLPAFDDQVGKDVESNPGHVKAPVHYEPIVDNPIRDDGFWLPYIFDAPVVKGLDLLGDGALALGKAFMNGAKACKMAVPVFSH